MISARNLDMDALGRLCDELVPDALFVTVSGAHLYGFASDDSDIDLRGAYQSPLRELVGLSAPPETRERTADVHGVEVDLVAHEAGKYLRLLTRDNGYILEQVFSPLVVRGAAFLERLRPLAAQCVTRNCHRHYRGFLQTQLKLLDKEEVKRAKSLLYAYRVLLTGVHLLRTGEVMADIHALNTWAKLDYLPELVRLKRDREAGSLPALDWGFHKAELARWEAELDRSAGESALPEAAPREAVNEFLLELRLGW